MRPSGFAQPRIPPVEGDTEAEGMLALNIFDPGPPPEADGPVSRLGGFLLYPGLLPDENGSWSSSAWASVAARCTSSVSTPASAPSPDSPSTRSGDWPRTARQVGTRPTATWLVFADELCATNGTTDQTWSRLAGRWSEAEMLELLTVAGFYRLVSGLLNSVGVQREPGTPGWPGGATRG